jgi:hypothetical protein
VLLARWGPASKTFSTMVFHSPQAGQRPIHLLLSLPHEVQYQSDLLFDPIVAIAQNRHPFVGGKTNLIIKCEVFSLFLFDNRRQD